MIQANQLRIRNIIGMNHSDTLTDQYRQIYLLQIDLIHRNSIKNISFFI